MTRTRTVVQMPVSPETHEEVKRRLVAAGYGRALNDHVGLDMDGLALVVEDDPEGSALRRERLSALMRSMNPDLGEEQAGEQAGVLIRTWDLLRLPKAEAHKACTVVGGRCVICWRIARTRTRRRPSRRSSGPKP